jgi:hypothetical protein
MTPSGIEPATCRCKMKKSRKFARNFDYVYTTGTGTGTYVDGTLAVDTFQVPEMSRRHTSIRGFTAAGVPKWDRKKDEKYIVEILFSASSCTRYRH